MTSRTPDLICYNCLHIKNFGCKAFPEGIPDEILISNKHDKPLPNQKNDLVFFDIMRLSSTLNKLLIQYYRTNPDAESLGALVDKVGEKEMLEIMLNRNGRQIRLITKKNALDFLEWEYI